jgi:SAM-dependent methyltransferase
VPDRAWTWDETLYAGSAAHYVKGRMPYPPELGARIVQAAGVGSEARALDVGCGPGPLTLLLAGSVTEVVGADADPEMLVQARLAAERAGVTNVSWRQIRAEQLPGDLGAFDLVTFAQSFHWMERERVAAAVRGMLREGGACVHVHATTNRGDSSSDPLPRPRPPYAQILALVISFLGPRQRAGRSVAPAIVAGSEIGIYRRAGFGGPLRIEVERGDVVERSIEEIVAATFSLSSSTPSLLGGDRERFEAELTQLLTESSDGGVFCERLRDVTFDVWRPR